jgi:pimeloyl-ACP methyl ester carboxylesterase
LRGFGDSARPFGGYDMPTMGEDIAQLMTRLGYDKFNISGEDWGATVALALTQAYPERVKKLCFAEMLMPGFGLEDWSHLTEENIRTDHWIWHINFYNVRDFPELLITGREKAYFSTFIKNECYDPTAVSDEAIDEYVRCYSAPGGLRAMFEVYRATFQDAEYFKKAAETKLKMPVLALGSTYFIGEEVTREMNLIAEDVTEVLLPWGHQLAEECPERLSEVLLDFFK